MNFLFDVFKTPLPLRFQALAPSIPNLRVDRGYQKSN